MYLRIKIKEQKQMLFKIDFRQKKIFVFLNLKFSFIYYRYKNLIYVFDALKRKSHLFLIFTLTNQRL